MNNNGMLLVTILSTLLVLTSCQSGPVQSTSVISVDETSEISKAETSTLENSTETNRSVVSSDLPEIETSQTEFITSLPNMRYIEFDGTTLPDGVYYISNCVYDEDRLGVTCSVYGFPYLLKEDIDLLNEGDTIKYNGYEYTVTSLQLENTDHPVSLDGYGLEKQFNDQYFLEDGCDYREIGTTIVDSYHLEISSNVAIWQGYIFGISKEDHDSWYLNNGYQNQLQQWGIDSANDLVFFSNIDELIAAWNQECEYEKFFCEKDNIEYKARLYGYYPGGLVVVKNQTITELYINPWQHQPMFLYTYRWNEENTEQ